jgi:hypothetical protein
MVSAQARCLVFAPEGLASPGRSELAPLQTRIASYDAKAIA